jgi:hypothetical protein
MVGESRRYLARRGRRADADRGQAVGDRAHLVAAPIGTSLA